MIGVVSPRFFLLVVALLRMTFNVSMIASRASRTMITLCSCFLFVTPADSFKQQEKGSTSNKLGSLFFVQSPGSQHLAVATAATAAAASNDDNRAKDNWGQGRLGPLSGGSWIQPGLAFPETEASFHPEAST